MNQQSHDPVKVTVKKRRLKKRHLGNGQVPNALHDPDVAQLIAAEIDERTAALRAMIAEAAYFRAEKRGFQPGHELDDWLAAEQEIARRMQQ